MTTSLHSNDEMSLSEDDPLIALLNNYHALNATVIDEFHGEEPSALEFMRYVARNRPFVVRGAAQKWTAFQRWNAAYLREKMGADEVQVVVTPKGNADAFIETANGEFLFVEPHDTFEIFSDVLTYIQEDSRLLSSRTTENGASRPVKYAQTQNDNLRQEYAILSEDVPNDIPFARIALQKSADAINFWLGNDRSVTSLHKDNYENIFVQIRGQKHFTLLPPVEMPCVNERELERARYILRDGQFFVERENLGDKVPIAVWDPDPDFTDPSSTFARHATPYSRFSQPLHITLQEGDMLYLPSLWYHKVRQTICDEGFVCAVNYWYDLDFAGHSWSSNALIRDVYRATSRSKELNG